MERIHGAGEVRIIMFGMSGDHTEFGKSIMGSSRQVVERGSNFIIFITIY
jgi:hypothetical protein